MNLARIKHLCVAKIISTGYLNGKKFNLELLAKEKKDYFKKFFSVISFLVKINFEQSAQEIGTN